MPLSHGRDTTSLFHDDLILSQAGGLDGLFNELRRGFTGEGETMTGIATGAGVILAIVFTFVIAHGIVRRIQKYSGDGAAPQRLFDSVMHQVGLGWIDRLLLNRVARTNRMRHPCAMLLESTLFDRAAEKWHAGGTVRLVTGWARARLANVRQTLFVAPPANAPSNPPAAPAT